MTLYVGKRLSYDGALCTVRFIGPLKGLKGNWIGVEWDTPTRGKHNGQHEGEQIFTCLSSSPTAGSFIRPTRKPDCSRTLLEAIKHKYGASSIYDGQIRPGKNDAIEISGKTVEEVGFDKIQKQISHLADLKVVLVDEQNMMGLARDKSQVQKAQVELAETCPSITELDVGWNPIEAWEDVADICVPLKKLRILKCSGLRLRLFEAEPLLDGSSPFQSIVELQLNECLLKPEQIFQLLSCSGRALFPSLRTLWLSQNELTSFHNSSLSLKFESVTTLVLENNKFTSLDTLANIFSHFPNVQHISLQGNSISTISPALANLPSPKISFLNIADNRIASFSFVDTLPTLFPNLTSLRISKNPLYDQSNIQPSSNEPADAKPTTFPSDSTYYLTLARIPSLLTLNYTTITPRDREEGEIYYLSVAEKDIRSILSSPQAPVEAATQKYPLYSSLCLKYDRPDILSSPPPTPTQKDDTPKYAPGTLGARLVTTTFYIPSTHLSSSSSEAQQKENTFSRPLPPSIGVYTLKSILAGHFGMPPLKFRLVYETGELDPVNETTTKLGRGREDWERWGEWDVDVKIKTTTDRSDNSTSDRNALGQELEEIEHNIEGEEEEDEKWVDGCLLKDGVRWKKREIEILDGMRGWGDYLENGVREVRIRVEPFDENWDRERDKWRREDLMDAIGKAGVGKE